MGVGAHSRLRRTRAGDFNLKDAISGSNWKRVCAKSLTTFWLHRCRPRVCPTSPALLEVQMTNKGLPLKRQVKRGELREAEWVRIQNELGRS